MVHMRIRGYYENGKRGWVRLYDEGTTASGPCDYNAEASLHAYPDTAGVSGESLFSAAPVNAMRSRPVMRTGVLRIEAKGRRRRACASLQHHCAREGLWKRELKLQGLEQYEHCGSFDSESRKNVRRPYSVICRLFPAIGMIGLQARHRSSADLSSCNDYPPRPQ